MTKQTPQLALNSIPMGDADMNYMANMQRAVDFIHNNVNNELVPDDIARQAYMSKSYFFKIFRYITGFSVKEYVMAYRLDGAARDLLTGEKRIIDIAFDCGFGSQQAFTKAFAKIYGIPPGAFRRTKKQAVPVKKLSLYYDGGIYMESIFQNVRFIDKNEFYVIGIEAKIDYNSNGHLKIKELWDSWVGEKIWERIPNPINYPVTMGMTEDTSKEETAVYRICMEVFTLDLTPKGLVGKIMPKASYAVFRLPLHQIGDFWQYFYKKWLPESGYEQPGALVTRGGWQMTSRAQLEVYGNVTCEDDEEIEMYAPILR